MTDHKIALVYFSATHVTRSFVRVMEAALVERGCKAMLFNVTPYDSRQEPLPLDDYDGIIFGFPVFADFAPSVINAWLPTLDGQGKRCATFFTYGGRATGYAHVHTRQLLEGAGFQVLFSAEFLGRHSFNVSGWRVLPDRPDKGDFSLAREYVDLVLDRFYQLDPPPFQLQETTGYSRAVAALRDQPKKAARRWPHPIRVADTCSMCRDCEPGCPTQAFDADSGLSDPGLCIECMHCVYICPDKVIETDPHKRVSHEDFMSFCKLTEEMLAAKVSMIIT